jgi:hypothetical protein
MSEQVVLSVVIPAVFLLCGIGLLIGGFVSVGRTRAFLRKAIETSGEVVDLLEEPPYESGESPTYRPVVSYVLPSSRRIRFQSMVHSNPPEYAIGESVAILYEPDRPHEARIRSFTSLWLLGIILVGLGMIFSALGAGLLLGGIPV